MIEFDHVKFPESISSGDVVWRNFLEIDSNSMSSEKGVLLKRRFTCFFPSISYNKVVLTKKIYFSPSFLKSWVHISDKIGLVVEGSP